MSGQAERSHPASQIRLNQESSPPVADTGVQPETGVDLPPPADVGVPMRPMPDVKVPIGAEPQVDPLVPHRPGVLPVVPNSSASPVGPSRGSAPEKTPVPAQAGKAQERRTGRRDAQPVEDAVYVAEHNKLAEYLDENNITPGSERFEALKFMARYEEYRGLRHQIIQKEKVFPSEEVGRIEEEFTVLERSYYDLMHNKYGVFLKSISDFRIIRSFYEDAHGVVRDYDHQKEFFDQLIHFDQIISGQLIKREARDQEDVQGLVEVYTGDASDAPVAAVPRRISDEELADQELYAGAHERFRSYLDESGVTPGTRDFDAFRRFARNEEFKWLYFSSITKKDGKYSAPEEIAQLDEGFKAAEMELEQLRDADPQLHMRMQRTFNQCQRDYEREVEERKTGMTTSMSHETQLKASRLIISQLDILEGITIVDAQSVIAAYEKSSPAQVIPTKARSITALGYGPDEVVDEVIFADAKDNLKEFLDQHGIVPGTPRYEALKLLARNEESLWLEIKSISTGKDSVPPEEARRIKDAYGQAHDELFALKTNDSDLYREVARVFEQIKKTYIETSEELKPGRSADVTVDTHIKVAEVINKHLLQLEGTDEPNVTELVAQQSGREISEHDEVKEDGYAKPRKRLETLLRYTDPHAQKVDVLKLFALETVMIREAAVAKEKGLDPSVSQYNLKNQVLIMQQDLRRRMGEEQYLTSQALFLYGISPAYRHAGNEAASEMLAGQEISPVQRGLLENEIAFESARIMLSDLEKITADAAAAWPPIIDAASQIPLSRQVLDSFMMGDWIPNMFRLEALVCTLNKEKATNKVRVHVAAREWGVLSDRKANGKIGREMKKAQRVRKQENDKLESNWKTGHDDYDFYEALWMSEDIYQAYVQEAQGISIFHTGNQQIDDALQHRHAINLLAKDVKHFTRNKKVIQVLDGILQMPVPEIPIPLPFPGRNKPEKTERDDLDVIASNRHNEQEVRNAIRIADEALKKKMEDLGFVPWSEHFEAVKLITKREELHWHQTKLQKDDAQGIKILRGEASRVNMSHQRALERLFVFQTRYPTDYYYLHPEVITLLSYYADAVRLDIKGEDVSNEEYHMRFARLMFTKLQKIEDDFKREHYM